MKIVRTILVASLLAFPAMLVDAQAGSLVAPAPAVAAEPNPGPNPDIDVHIGGGTEKHVWFVDPVVLAVAGVGVIMLLFVIAMVGRGGTTIIKE